jgi:hypothetical protein
MLCTMSTWAVGFTAPPIRWIPGVRRPELTTHALLVKVKQSLYRPRGFLEDDAPRFQDIRLMKVRYTQQLYSFLFLREKFQ